MAPTCSGLAACTLSTSSTCSNQGVIASALKSPSPRACQSASTSSGVRMQVPELMVVVPPTLRPTGTGIMALPVAQLLPSARYSLGITSVSRPLKWERS